VPGSAKAPEALREAGLFKIFGELGGYEAGVVIPGKYADVTSEGSLRNQEAIIEFTKSLEERVTGILHDGNAPLVIGGDCSVLLGDTIALRKLGKYGLVHLDGHTDFRHPGNSERCASLAGEDLAAVVGLHWNEISNMEGLGPYVEPRNVIQVGCRDEDEFLSEAKKVLGKVLPASYITSNGEFKVGSEIANGMGQLGVDGYWIHLDVDILDPDIMPAVDSPSPGGLTAKQLVGLLESLAPGAIGAEVTIFDPDLDPDGRYARLLTDILAKGLRHLGGGQ
jgi:arginase